jgi:hypothetical protein
VSKEGFETWQDTGLDQVVQDSGSAKLKSNELVIQKKVPGVGGASATSTGTRIAATDASFGGNVRVAGAILTLPQGDIGMGNYTNGPTP